MEKDNDLYKVLSVGHDATNEQIKSSYRKLALKHHPDKGGNPERFKELSRAYQILSNYDLRSKYDQLLPISDIDLIPPLKVFADCFNQWLSQYPLVEFIFKDSCQDVIKLLNNHNDNPVMKLLIDSLVKNEIQPVSTEQLLKATQFFAAEWFQQLCHPIQVRCEQIIVNKKVYVTYDDVYTGKRYPHQFTITNEDLRLSNDYRIINAEIQINIPLEHNEIEIETDLHIINHKNHTCYTQKTCVQLEVIINSYPNLCKIGDHDLLIYIDITLPELMGKKILTIKYFNHKLLCFNNPYNCNMRQLYKINNIAFPIREQKKRGNLYILFNLIIHQDQHSMIIDNTEHGYLYQLIPVDPYLLYRTDDSYSGQLPIYSTDKVIIKCE